MKKRILIINSHFNIGGIETAMVNMANALCEDFDINLFVYYPEGPIKERLDPKVHVLNPCFAIKAMGMSLKQAVKSKNLLIIIFKVLGTFWARLFDNRLPVKIAAKMQKKLIGYDLAIAYRQEGRKSTIESGFVRILNSRVEAKKKLAWIHCDSTEFVDRQQFNRKYYKQVDKIIGVSESVADAFAKVNPDLKGKTDYCYNFLDYTQLYKKSEEEQGVKYPEDKFICFSASRLDTEKALVRSIKAMAPVFKEHTDVMWFIAGDGKERNNIEETIKQEGLQERIILLGNQNNPYPYMKNADLFMLTSYHEAAPVVYMEAKALGIPVFTTKTLSSEELLSDGVDSFICDNSENGIYDCFKKLMADRSRIDEAKLKLKDYVGNNSESLKKVKEMLD